MDRTEEENNFIQAHGIYTEHAYSLKDGTRYIRIKSCFTQKEAKALIPCLQKFIEIGEI